MKWIPVMASIWTVCKCLTDLRSVIMSKSCSMQVDLKDYGEFGGRDEEGGDGGV